MTVNVHNPVRLADEPYESYVLRRKESQRLVKLLLHPELGSDRVDPRLLGGPKKSKNPGNRKHNYGQHPKFAKVRKHKPHVHPLRDSDGNGFTWTGRNPDGTRRMWVAGESQWTV